MSPADLLVDVTGDDGTSRRNVPLREAVGGDPEEYDDCHETLLADGHCTTGGGALPLYHMELVRNVELERIPVVWKRSGRVGKAKRAHQSRARWARREERAFAHPTSDSSRSKSALAVLRAGTASTKDEVPRRQVVRLRAGIRKAADSTTDPVTRNHLNELLGGR
jgi:hypothetical protein